MKYLPPEIWRLIYEYDDTYYTKYKEVMKDLKNVFLNIIGTFTMQCIVMI